MYPAQSEDERAQGLKSDRDTIFQPELELLWHREHHSSAVKEVSEIGMIHNYLPTFKKEARF